MLRFAIGCDKGRVAAMALEHWLVEVGGVPGVRRALCAVAPARQLTAIIVAGSRTGPILHTSGSAEEPEAKGEPC
jgi:hypothetical protein